MAGKLRQSGRGQYTRTFRRSHALIVGINAYSKGIRPLTTPVNDATRLAQLLADEHGYTVHLLAEDVSKARLAAAFDTLSVGDNDRLLFYFAGHGVALDGEDGPQGFLVPQDAEATDRNTLLPMTELNGWLDALACRHMLAILDCCFAGAFRWAATRRVETAGLEVIHQERFERFIQSPAWQVLTSSAHNQTALDVVGGNAVGSRGIREEDGRPHSPFALALYDALKGEGDLIPKGDGDGVITATELYLYLRQTVEVGVAEAVNHDQTPGLWPLRKHDRGEFIFLTPGHALNLPPAPPLTDALNPWRGLQSYDQKHGNLFFGRDDEIAELAQRVEQQPLTAVLGASGTGKSSLVKAGLLPYLTQQETDWRILQPLRPGNTPIATLHKMLAQQLDEHASGRTITQMRHDTQTVANLVASWKASHPEQKLLLVIDQFEELVTLSSDKEREQFIQLLTKAVEQHRDCFRLIVTVRTDFEPQFDADMSLVPYWSAARYVVPPMDQADLRQVIEGPAALRVLYFEPAEMVDTLISEVLQTPGALPLLSFTLSEMYLHYLGRKADDRALTEEDYDALGGVIGSLRNRANAEYGTLPDDAHRETMRRVMLRMISVEGGELARRRVSRSELQYPTSAENVRVETVLNRLVTARLLVTGDDEGVPTIEPAHDALVLAWDKLLRWKQSAEIYLLLQRRLAQAAVEWHHADATAQSGLLWDDDPRLPQLEETLWPTHTKLYGLRGRMNWTRQILFPNTNTPANTRWLNGVEIQFVQTSVRNRAQFWRRLVSGVLLFILVLIGATIISLTLQQRAVAAEAEANARATEVIARTTSESQAVNSQATEVVVRRTAEANAVSESNARATEVIVRTTAESEAIEQQHVAETRQAEAEQQARLALAQSLASLAPTVTDLQQTEFDLQLLLALEALHITEENGGNAGWLAERALRDILVQPDLKHTLEGHTESVQSVAFSPLDGRWLASGSDDNSVRIWDLANPTFPPRVLSEPTNPVQSIAFSPNGQQLAAGGDGKILHVWDLESQKDEPIVLTGDYDPIRFVSFSPDGQYLIAGSSRGVLYESGNGVLQVWDLSNPISPVILTDYYLAAAFLDSQWFLSLSHEGDVHKWELASLLTDDVKTPDLLASVDVPSEDLDALAFSKDGQWLAFGYSNENVQQKVRVLNLTAPNSEPITFVGRTGSVSKLTFSPDGQYLASANSDLSAIGGNTVRIWDLSNPDANPIILSLGDESHINGLAFSPNGQKLVTGNNDNTVRVWNLGDPAAKPLINSDHDFWVLAGTFAPSDGQQWIVSGGDSTLRVWDLTNPNNHSRLLMEDTDGTWSISFSPDGKWLATGEENGTVQIWNFLNFSLTGADQLDSIKTLRFPESPRVTSVAFSPDGQWLAAGSLGKQFDDEIRVWSGSNLDSDPLILSVEDPIQSIAFSPPDSKWLAVGGWRNTLQLWDTSEFSVNGGTLSEPSVTYCDPGGPIIHYSLSFSSDGRWLASGSSDPPWLASDTDNNVVRIWDLSNPDLNDGRLCKPSITLSGHRGGVTSVAFSPDGRWLASGSEDRTVRVWDLDNPEADPFIHDYHDNIVNFVTFSKDGNLLVTGSHDGTIRVVPTLKHLQRLACENVSNNLTEAEWDLYVNDIVSYREQCDLEHDIPVWWTNES